MADTSTQSSTSATTDLYISKIQEILSVFHTSDHETNKVVLRYFLTSIVKSLGEYDSVSEIVNLVKQTIRETDDDSEDDDELPESEGEDEEMLSVSSHEKFWELVDSGEISVGKNVFIKITEPSPSNSEGVSYSTKIVADKAFFCEDESSNASLRDSFGEGTIFVDNPLQDEERMYRTLPDGTTHEVQMQYLENYTAYICNISV